MRFPGGAGPAGVRVAAVTDLLDLAPTVADVFGTLGDDAAQRFSGTSLLVPRRGARVRGHAQRHGPTYAIRDGRFTLIRSLRYAQERLFDARQDPLERHDLAERLPLQAAAARARLLLWLARLRRSPPDAGEAPLTPEQLENLRALGYVN